MDIVIAIDESSSMTDYKESYVQMINSFITEQGRLWGNAPIKAYLTLIMFASGIRVRCVKIDITSLAGESFTSEMYTPHGATCLYDAIGHSISSLEMVTPMRPVILIVMTDGEDTASCVHTKDTITRLVSSFARKKDSCLVWLGSSPAVVDQGRYIGFNHVCTYSESSTSIGRCVDVLNCAVGHFVADLTGVPNEYSATPVRDDVSDIMDMLGSMDLN